MSDEPKAQVAAPPWLTKPALAGLVAIGIAYGWLRLSFGPATLAEHGQLGDALAPVAELLMLAALLAALYSAQLQRIELGLQRKELALQRKEMRESREEMIEQRKQLERTAEAQEALAGATRLLADAQLGANGRAARLELAQRAGTFATLTNAIAVAEAAFTAAHPSAAADRRNHFVKHVQEIIDSQMKDYNDLHAEIFGDSGGEGTTDAS